MPAKSEIYAGFYDDEEFEEIEEEMEHPMKLRKYLLFSLPLALFVLALCLGCVKGALGCCSFRVGSWKYNYAHPPLGYRESSRIRRFVVNIFFFFLLPFAWCLNCCSSSIDDADSNVSIRGQRVIQMEIYSSEDSDDNEDVRLLKSTSSLYDQKSAFNGKSSESVFDVRRLPNPYDSSSRDVELERDTTFVVNAINESHESLQKLESHQSQINVSSEADEFVEMLLTARVVYRRFNEPQGLVKVNDSQEYSIRGYFIPALGSGFRFMTYNPIRQMYEISSTLTLVPLTPQFPLESKAFRCFYANKIEVLKANDLSVHPSLKAPCVNVLVQVNSMYGV